MSVRIEIPHPFEETRSFVADELPEIVYSKCTEAKLGGKTLMKMTGSANRSHRRIIEDTPEGSHVSVFLGKPSKSLLHGFARAQVKSHGDESRTLVEISVERNGFAYLGLRLVGFLFCLLPGLLLLVIDATWSSHHQTAFQAAAAEVRQRYPAARISQ